MEEVQKPKPKQRKRRRFSLRRKRKAEPKLNETGNNAQANDVEWKWWYKLALTGVGFGADQEYLLEYLALLIRSGMDMSRAIASIEEEMRSPAIKYVVHTMRDDVLAGISLSEVFRRSKIFPEQVISLVQIGEESGKLPENLEAIVLQQQKDRSFKSKLRSAMMYPFFILFVTGVIGVGVAWFILPRLAGVFASLNLDLPLITRLVIAFGVWLQEWGFVVIPLGSIIFFVILYMVFIFSKTRFIGQWFMFKVPGVGRLVQEVELSRFGYVLGSLLEAGLPIDASLEALKRSTMFFNYKKFYTYMQVQVVDGETFRYVFNTYKHSRKLLPGPIQQMISTAEMSANLAGTLKEVGASYELKTETTTKNLSVVLEPILLIIVWLGVVFLALAVIMPIYGLIGGISDTTNVTNARSDASVQVIESGR